MRLLFALFCLTAWAAPALAADPSIRPVYEADGSFGFCLGEQTYANGRKLTVALSPKAEINVGATIPAAGFKRSARYDVFMTIGDDEPRKVRAYALDDETLLMQMGGNRTFKDKLSASKTLSLGAGGKTIAFALPPMDRLMGTLQKCLTEHKGKRLLPQDTPATTQQEPSFLPSPADKPITATATSAPAPARPAVAQQEAVLPVSIQNLLTTAGVGPVRPLSMTDMPEEKRPADFIWETGSILGGVREREAPDGKTLSDLIGIHMRGLEKKCGGDFRADVSRENVAPNLRLRTAEATCSPEKGQTGQAVTVGLVFYLLDSKYFTVLTHEGISENKGEVLTARDKIARAMLNRAAEVGLKTP